jgi:MYXO-CTERM domain-containing protein
LFNQLESSSKPPLHTRWFIHGSSQYDQKRERETMKTIIVAVAAFAACTSSAMADLVGTDMTISVTHAGSFSGISALLNKNYTYGNTETETTPGWGSIVITSPESALAPGLENVMKLNLTGFNYNAFAGPFATTGTVKITDIDLPFDLSSVQILVNGSNIATAVAASGNGFQASWNTQTVLTGNPTAPSVVVAWNSATVPAPGALALLGFAGILSQRRRRRA